MIIGETGGEDKYIVYTKCIWPILILMSELIVHHIIYAIYIYIVSHLYRYIIYIDMLVTSS